MEQKTAHSAKTKSRLGVGYTGPAPPVEAQAVGRVRAVDSRFRGNDDLQGTHPGKVIPSGARNLALVLPIMAQLQGQSEILRFAQDDDEGLRMTAKGSEWLAFVRAEGGMTANIRSPFLDLR